jgi:hypothetical protein
MKVKGDLIKRRHLEKHGPAGPSEVLHLKRPIQSDILEVRGTYHRIIIVV